MATPVPALFGLLALPFNETGKANRTLKAGFAGWVQLRVFTFWYDPANPGEPGTYATNIARLDSLTFTVTYDGESEEHPNVLPTVQHILPLEMRDFFYPVETDADDAGHEVSILGTLKGMWLDPTTQQPLFPLIAQYGSSFSVVA